MRCNHIQRLIISEGEGRLSATDRTRVEEHTAQCGECARFRRDLETIRRGVAEMPQPQLSRLLAEETERCCREAARSGSAGTIPLPARWRRFPIPRLIWAAIPVLLILTVSFMAFGLNDLLNQSVSLSAAAFIALLLQNGVMLVLAPILILSHRRRSSTPWKSGGHYAV